MLANIPISLPPNAPFSKNPQSIHESQKGAGDFSITFAAAAASRRNSEDFSQSTSKGKGGAKAECKEGRGSLKDPGSMGQPDLSEDEKPDKIAQDFETETLASTPLPNEEELLQTAAPELLLGLSNEKQIAHDVGVSEGLKGEISLLGTPKSSEGINPQNPIIDKEQNIQVTSPLNDAEIGRSVSTKGHKLSSEAKQNIEVQNTQLGTEIKAGPSFGDVSAKLSGNEAERQSEDVKSMLKFAGERSVNGEIAETGNSRKGVESLDSLTVKAPQLNSMSDASKEKATPNPARNLDSQWKAPSGDSGKFSYEPKISDEASRSKESEKTTLSSKRPTISTIAIEKNKAAVGDEVGRSKESEKTTLSSKRPTIATEKNTTPLGRDGNGTAFVSRRGHKTGVTLGENQPPLNGSMKMEAVAGNAMGTSNTGSVSNDNALLSKLSPAMEIISGEAKIVEKSDGSQKDLPTNSSETSVKVGDFRETESQPSRSGPDNREGQNESENRNGFQGKDFHGTLEKLEITKGEDVPPVSKTRYGSNNGPDPVSLEIEKEIQRSPGGKENLGTLVRATAFLLKNGRQEARIALHPESLGHLKISISTENHQVTVKVMAETMAAKELIEHNLHQLKADFQNQGLEITKFDISLSQDSDRNGAGQNPSFASNRTKDKSASKKEESPRQSEKTEKTTSTANRAHHNDAVDFFA